MEYDGEKFDLDITCDAPGATELRDINEQLALYIKENERLAKELRNCRHNTLNIIHGINGFIELEDWNGLKEYFYDILEKSRQASNESISSIEKILNLLLKKLIYSKLKTAMSKGIDIKIMIDENILIESNLISETDLCKVIGKFLGNAIEASSAAYNKKVSMYILNNKKSVNIIIENTFNASSSISLIKAEAAVTEYEQPDEQPASIILSKYPNILNNTFIQHQIFVQELQIIK